MTLQLAWRNIWRNKRRTLITVSAVAFAVFISSFMRSFQKGIWDSVIDGAVSQYYGFVQVHKAGYWEDQTIDNAFLNESYLYNIAEESDHIEDVIPRLESFALASEGSLTEGVLVLGVDPVKEAKMINIEPKLVAGKYLSESDGIMISIGLSEKLKLGLQDTLILISQGYHGANAAGKFPIAGIFRFPLPDLNKRLVVMNLSQAQEFYDAIGLVTSLALNLDDRRSLSDAMATLDAKLKPKENYEVMPWNDLIPELVEARQVDEAGGILVLVILYFVIAFAIFGTIIMMTKERSYEFGVLTAIGMGRWPLFFSVFLETIFIAIIGAIVGILLSIPIVYYLRVNPIPVSAFGDGASEAFEKFGMSGDLPTAFEWSIFGLQGLVILVITALLAFYPLIKIMKLKPIEAMRE